MPMKDRKKQKITLEQTNTDSLEQFFAAKRLEQKRLAHKIFIIFLFFILGLCILLYPAVSNQFNQWRANRLKSTYHQEIGKETDLQHFEQEREAARKYNETLVGQSVPDVFVIREHKGDAEYESLLNVNGDGLMGFVEIPSIKVDIPIFHYTTDEVLKQNVGHLLGSSLPVGGLGTHTVLSAHRSLPGAKLFSDLNLLKEGDTFYLRVLDQVMAYQVNQIVEVNPQDASSLAIDPDKDYCTLFTCTPYGVNSKRLLVRGERIPYSAQEAEDQLIDEQEQTKVGRIDWQRILLQISAGAVGCLAGVLLLHLLTKKQRQSDHG